MNEALYKLQKYTITYDRLFDGEPSKHKCLKLNEVNDLILIKEKNILFWIFFISKYSYSEYLDLERKKYVSQEKEKYKNVDRFNEDASIFKVHKLKKMNTINNLLYEEVDIHTFKALCIYNSISVIVSYEYMYIDLNYGSSYTYIFVKEGDYYYMNPYTKELDLKIKNEKIQITNFCKKLNSMSYYKVSELQDIAKKINIDIYESTNKKKKKIVLYDEIKLKLNKL